MSTQYAGENLYQRMAALREKLEDANLGDERKCEIRSQISELDLAIDHIETSNQSKVTGNLMSMYKASANGLCKQWNLGAYKEIGMPGDSISELKLSPISELKLSPISKLKLSPISKLNLQFRDAITRGQFAWLKANKNEYHPALNFTNVLALAANLGFFEMLKWLEKAFKLVSRHNTDEVQNVATAPIKRWMQSLKHN